MSAKISADDVRTALGGHLSHQRFRVFTDGERLWVSFHDGIRQQVRMGMDRHGFAYRPGMSSTVTMTERDTRMFEVTGRVNGAVMTRCFGSPATYTAENRGRCMNKFKHMPNGSVPLCHVHRKKGFYGSS